MPETTTYYLEKELTALENAFFAKLKAFDNLSKDERIQLALQVDFFQELADAGLTNVINKLVREYGSLISELEALKPKGVAPITLRELDVLIRLDAEILLGKAKIYANEFKSELIKGYISGESQEIIISRLKESGLATNQLIAATQTAKDTFRASATAKLFEDEPETRLLLGDVLDDRTRCSCKAVLLFQPENGYTKAEIDAGAWTKLAQQHCPKFEGEYTFTFRGGFNCRHYPKIV